MNRPKRTKLDIIKICKKVRLIDDNKVNPTIYHYEHYFSYNNSIKVLKDKEIYYEPILLKLDEVEPFLNEADLQKIDRMDNRIKYTDNAASIIIGGLLNKVIDLLGVPPASTKTKEERPKASQNRINFSSGFKIKNDEEK